MKNLLIASMLVLSSLSFAQAGEIKKALPAAGKVAGATALSGASVGLNLVNAASLVEGGTTTVGMAFTGVTLAAASGYMIGSVIVEVDKTYFRGVLVSEVGQFLGPINRRIYNMTHEDTLPEVIVTKDGSYKVLNQGDKR